VLLADSIVSRRHLQPDNFFSSTTTTEKQLLSKSTIEDNPQLGYMKKFVIKKMK